MAKIHIIFAAEAPVAVILRRGPSKWFHVLKWSTRKDIIEPGAWFRGRLYEDGCDLSPDGKLFVYSAAKERQEYEPGYTGAWTAVSKPPWLTALALWPRKSTWDGNAYFADKRSIVIDCCHWEKLHPHPKHRPQDLTVIPRWIGTDAPEQHLAEPPWKFAHFDGEKGCDYHGQPFSLENGCLCREGNEGKKTIADFGTQTPDPTPSPSWARKW